MMTVLYLHDFLCRSFILAKENSFIVHYTYLVLLSTLFDDFIPPYPESFILEIRLLEFDDARSLKILAANIADRVLKKQKSMLPFHHEENMKALFIPSPLQLEKFPKY